MCEIGEKFLDDGWPRSEVTTTNSVAILITGVSKLTDVYETWYEYDADREGLSKVGAVHFSLVNTTNVKTVYTW